MRPIQESDIFHAIAHPARRAMLSALTLGECSAGELAEPFHMTLPAVSQHLRILEAANLVLPRREGRQRLYRLQAQPLSEVKNWADTFAIYFSGRLDALGHYLDRKHGNQELARKPSPRPAKARS